MESATNYEKQRLLAYCDSVASGRPLSAWARIELRLARAVASTPKIPASLLNRRRRRLQAALAARGSNGQRRVDVMLVIGLLALLPPLAAILGILSWLDVSPNDVLGLVTDVSLRPFLVFFALIAAALSLIAVRKRTRPLRSPAARRS